MVRLLLHSFCAIKGSFLLLRFTLYFAQRFCITLHNRKENKMLQFDNKIVEKALLDHYENPRILTYLNEKGEQVIHLKVENVDTTMADINLAEIDSKVKKSIQNDEDLLTKMIIQHYYVYYHCYNVDSDIDTMHKNLKYLRMLPVSREQNPYIEVLDLKFEPVFYLRSYFKNFNIKIKGEKLEELENFLKPLQSDAYDVARMNVQRGYHFKIMKNENFPDILTEQNREPVTQLFLFPKYMERIFDSIEYDEIVLKLPNNRNIAFLSYDEYERHPEKLKKMNGYPTLYYYKKGEGLTILGE